MGKKYFNLQLKSIFKIYPAILLITALIVAGIAISCTALMSQSSQSQEKKKVSVGVVGNLENSYLEIGLNALQNLDSSRFYFDFREYEEADAEKALKKREIDGYLYIPDDFVKKIYRGENLPAKYITLDSPDGFGAIVASEVTEAISDMLTASQVGMYSMQDAAYEFDRKNIKKHNKKLTNEYVEVIFTRQETYDVEIVGIADYLSLGGYYVCGLIILLLMLWGISCNRIFTARNREVSLMLKISGMKPFSQLVCEYGAYLTVTAFTAVLFAAVFATVLRYTDVPIPELFGVTVTDAVLFIVKILPVIVMITLMHTVFYEIIQNRVGAILMQFVLSIGLGYISGCFYPNYFFPDAIQKLSYILPVGMAFSYVRKAMLGGVLVNELSAVCLYSVLFFVVTAFIRERRLAGDRR